MHVRRRIHACVRGRGSKHHACEEEDTCMCEREREQAPCM
jgi:hypothetical protein